jgi:choline kinase
MVNHLMRYGEGVNRWYLSAIDELAQEHPVRTCDIHGLSWCEVDEAEDLAHAQTVVQGWPSAAADVVPARRTANGQRAS